MKILLFLLTFSLLIGCTKDNDPVANKPLLKSYTTSFQDQFNQFVPSQKIEYYYSSSGALIRDEVFSYDYDSKTYVHYSTSKYSYSQDKVVSIERSIDGNTNKIVTTYEYSDNKISKIKLDDNLDTEATIHYLPDNKVEVLYNVSNGRFFTYRFTMANENQVLEQTLNESQQLSNEIKHTYDNKKNPFSLLGYIDIFFANISASNRIKTESNYISDSFPSVMPVSYVYQYNSLDFPTERITTYLSAGKSGITSLQKAEFEYY